jgi:hypothetical protein
VYDCLSTVFGPNFRIEPRYFEPSASKHKYTITIDDDWYRQLSLDMSKVLLIAIPEITSPDPPEATL